jgi:hypothetical protein
MKDIFQKGLKNSFNGYFKKKEFTLPQYNQLLNEIF